MLNAQCICSTSMPTSGFPKSIKSETWKSTIHLRELLIRLTRRVRQTPEPESESAYCRYRQNLGARSYTPFSPYFSHASCSQPARPLLNSAVILSTNYRKTGVFESKTRSLLPNYALFIIFKLLEGSSLSKGCPFPAVSACARNLRCEHSNPLESNAYPSNLSPKCILAR